jgi:hypothetical protein
MSLLTRNSRAGVYYFILLLLSNEHLTGLLPIAKESPVLFYT